jgi:hypothetical protein
LAAHLAGFRGFSRQRVSAFLLRTRATQAGILPGVIEQGHCEYPILMEIVGR